MIKLKTTKPEPTECERIQALADEIKAHKDRMMELINLEAAKDKESARGLPIQMLVQQICKHGKCECDALLMRLGANFRAEELKLKALAEKEAVNG